MSLHELAEEYALTDLAAADLCTRLGISVSSAGQRLSAADVARFRAAAGAELAQGAAPAAPAPSPDAPVAPFAAPDDVAAGWAAPEPTGPWAPGTNGHGVDQGAGPQPGAPPAAGDGGPTWERSANLARLDAARAQARTFTNQGYALLALGLVIALATMALAGGGFFIVSFGTGFVGFRRLRAGRMLNAQIRRAEDELGAG